MSEFRPLTWHPSQEPGSKASDGTWGCPDAAQPYPAMHHSLVHPCTSPVMECCGLPQASFNLRFHSFLAAPKGMLLMAYEVHRFLPLAKFLDAQHNACCGHTAIFTYQRYIAISEASTQQSFWTSMAVCAAIGA